MIQHLDPARTTWHLTFGTYGARLHGDGRPTVDRDHNQRGEPFVKHDPDRAKAERDKMRGNPVRLAAPQRAFVEAVIPDICKRGGWTYRVCAAPDDEDHVHVLLDADPSIDPDAILKWLKRWLGEALTARWGKAISGTWWAKGGSTPPVDNEQYLNNAYHYIRRQRTLPQSE
jgi:REP element-mobilizing transposase RayT